MRSILTLLVLRGGREVARIVDAQPKAEIAPRLERVTPEEVAVARTVVRKLDLTTSLV